MEIVPRCRQAAHPARRRPDGTRRPGRTAHDRHSFHSAQRCPGPPSMGSPPRERLPAPGSCGPPPRGAAPPVGDHLSGLSGPTTRGVPQPPPSRQPAQAQPPLSGQTAHVHPEQRGKPPNEQHPTAREAAQRTAPHGEGSRPTNSTPRRGKPANEQHPHGEGATRGVRGVVPPDKHCEPMRSRPKAASIGRRRVATGANHPASRSSAFRRGPGTPAAVPRRGTRAPI